MFEKFLFLIPGVKSHLSLTIAQLSILFVVSFYTHIELIWLPVMLPSFGLYPENASHFPYYPPKKIMKEISFKNY